MSNKTYIIEKEDKTRVRVTVPEEWKVTFGPAARGSNSTSGRTLKMPMALRFYEADNKQRAIFTDVISFRDASILIEEEKTDIQEKDGFTECDGKRQRTTFQVKRKKWINPDDSISDEPLLIDETIHQEID